MCLVIMLKVSTSFLRAVRYSSCISPAETSASKSLARLPPLPSPRDLLKLYRIRALRNLSQNFILDHRLTNKIVTKTGNIQDCYVCEVGPGPGNITRPIIQNGAKEVTVVEKDPRFLPALQLLADAWGGKFNIIQGDIMDLSLESVFPSEFAEEWTMPSPPFYIIGNLPFNVSTPLIIRWLRHCSTHTGPFAHGRTRLTLTFQKEVGQRMVAEPGSDMRCRLSLMCQYLCHVNLLFMIPGRAFIPKPDVDVAVVKFTPRIKPLISQPFDLIEKVMRVVFHHRQKYCSYGISLLFPEKRPELAETVFSRTGINPQKRSFELETAEFSDLCDVYSELCSENEGLIDYNFRGSKRAAAKLVQSVPYMDFVPDYIPETPEDGASVDLSCN